MKYRMQAPVLSRKEIERLATHVALNRNVDRVQIIQRAETGIGLSTFARCYCGEQYTDVEVTDYEAW